MRISSIARINLSIVMLCLTAILFCLFIGILPDERAMTASVRAKLCESMTSSVSYSISRHDLRQVGKQLEYFASQNDDLVSIGLRRYDGDLVVEVGEHKEGWRDAVRSNVDGVYKVPISNRETEWGSLEIRFQPLYSGASVFLSHSMLKLLVIVGVLVGTACWFHLRHMLRYLDPNRSVPPRVREVLDSFAEGVLVLDEDERIVLVNRTFAKHVGKTSEALIGMGLWDLPWRIPDNVADSDSDERVNGDGEPVKATQMQLADETGQIVAIFSANSTPVTDDQGNSKGVMMAFTDVTPLERNRAALLSTLQELSRSKEEISEQNRELRYLATRDPLTSCINRRTFFELFEKHWLDAKTKNIPLCGMMVDIDFFKPINDTYGHSMGDEVLRNTGKLLNAMTREDDVVCRYGGEEFAILFPGLDLEAAEKAAECIRVRMSEMEFPGFTITASLGVSAFSLGAESPQDMLDQADKCLYVAKRNGRNQVVRFDTVPEDLVVDESRISRTKPVENMDAGPAIPYAAVTALLSALSFRDHQTGTHSSRVSAYAALLAQRVMRPKEVFVVEMAALLHDIGKVGVPDAILLKPGKLSEEEWEFMNKHDRIGVEIINRSFKHPGLTDIVKYHHLQFGGEKSDPEALSGDDIPIGARILSVADAYDSMISDRPYRKGMSLADAITELRRCSGTQFDPELVEMFVEIIESGCDLRGPSEDESYTNDVVLSIGEQIERLVEAADTGDNETFIALAERLRETAQQHNVDIITDAANQAIQVANEDAQLDQLVAESLELLTACRLMRANLTSNQDEAALSLQTAVS